MLSSNMLGFVDGKTQGGHLQTVDGRIRYDDYVVVCSHVVRRDGPAADRGGGRLSKLSIGVVSRQCGYGNEKLEDNYIRQDKCDSGSDEKTTLLLVTTQATGCSCYIG